MNPHIRFKSKRINHRDQAADRVERGAGNGAVGEDVPATAREDCVERGDGIGGACHAAGVDRLHEARGGHEEGRVDGAAGGGNNLATTAEDGFGG